MENRHLCRGTPEECRAAVEKQKPKKPVMDGYCGFESYECPTCHHDISNEQKYCDKCGQKLGDDDWHHRGLGRAVEIVKRGGVDGKIDCCKCV